MSTRHPARIVTCACALAALAATVRASEPIATPKVVSEANRGLVLTDLPPVLTEPSVAPHLTKGLTTTFIFRIDLIGRSNHKDIGGARIEIRYELWDEVFKVRMIEIDGQIRRTELDTSDALSEWWQDLELLVVPSSSSSIDGSTQARIGLEVVPFSQAEQTETQEWFSQSVSSAELARTEGVSTSVSGTEKQGNGVFSVLIATSIRRRPLTTFSWTVELSQGRSP